MPTAVAYLDFVSSWGALILGHAHPEVVEAIADAAKHGTTFGAPCPAEVELAERVVASYPGARAGALRVLRHRSRDERHPRWRARSRGAISS